MRQAFFPVLPGRQLVMLDRKWRHTRPQLFGDSRAAAQARRAAGVSLTPGDTNHLIETHRPATRFKSARSILRRMLRLSGKRAADFGTITARWDHRRRRALGWAPPPIARGVGRGIRYTKGRR